MMVISIQLCDQETNRVEGGFNQGAGEYMFPGVVRALPSGVVRSDAVNDVLTMDPRWSPDGTRIAAVQHRREAAPVQLQPQRFVGQIAAARQHAGGDVAQFVDDGRLVAARLQPDRVLGDAVPEWQAHVPHRPLLFVEQQQRGPARRREIGRRLHDDAAGEAGGVDLRDAIDIWNDARHEVHIGQPRPQFGLAAIEMLGAGEVHG